MKNRPKKADVPRSTDFESLCFKSTSESLASRLVGSEVCQSAWRPCLSGSKKSAQSSASAASCKSTQGLAPKGHRPLGYGPRHHEAQGAFAASAWRPLVEAARHVHPAKELIAIPKGQPHEAGPCFSALLGAPVLRSLARGLQPRRREPGAAARGIRHQDLDSERPTSRTPKGLPWRSRRLGSISAKPRPIRNQPLNGKR